MRCPVCSEVIPSGPNCLVDDTACFDVTGSGTELDPYVVVPDLSSDVDQLLACTASGLYAAVPTSISNRPSVQAYHSVVQSVVNDTETTVALNSELYDTDSMHDNTTNNSRLTFTTAGFYEVVFNGVWNKHATGDRIARIRKNGTDYLEHEAKRTGGSDLLVGHCLSIQEAFAAADYVEARVRQTSGSNLLLLSDPFSPILSASRVA